MWLRRQIHTKISVLSQGELTSLLFCSENAVSDTLTHLFLEGHLSTMITSSLCLLGPGQLSQCLLPSRNGLPVRADGHRVHQSPDGTLLIHKLQARDEGSYTCSAYRGSQAVSRSTEVKVIAPGKRPTPGTCLSRELALCCPRRGRARSAVWGALARVLAHVASSW